ncbi:hypothetical protein GmHk_02G004782 [Glycine max]|nr:hypothetical protein GmHk_02G004782 [Glycine max]
MYFNTLAVESSSSTRPNEFEFTTKLDLSNEELDPFSEDEDKVYMEVLNKVIEDTLRKENTHNILEFNRCDTRFLVQETINSREVWPIGDFIVKLDEIWCNCDKFQKLHMPCSHVVATCKHAHPVYMLESVSNVYKGLFEELYNEAYWPLCHEPMISPDP